MVTFVRNLFMRSSYRRTDTSKLTGCCEVKIKLSVCWTKYHVLRTYWGSGGIDTRLLTSALNGGVWSASRSGRFTSGEGAPRAHSLGEKTKFLSLMTKLRTQRHTLC
jgi:hypothetical protein